MTGVHALPCMATHLSVEPQSAADGAVLLWLQMSQCQMAILGQGTYMSPQVDASTYKVMGHGVTQPLVGSATGNVLNM